MIGTVANHLWQSTAFASAVGLFTLAFRKNRAQVRFQLWLCASLKFLVPFSILMSLGSHWELGPAVKKAAPPAVSAAVIEISQPFMELSLQQAAPSAPRARDWLPIAILGGWVCGFAIIAAVRLRDWRGIKAALRASAPTNIPARVEVRSSPGLLEPGAVGWLRPVLLLPAGIEDHLTPAQLKAVLAHELCHIARRDNLTSAIHMFVEAVFWFHPLVWWIGSRLIEERERACDEEVLRVTGDPKAYADAILNVCKRYVESPLVCVPGVSGSNLKKRIEAIMTDRLVLRLNFVKKIAIATAGVAVLTLPILVGVMNTSSTSAQSTERARFVTGSIRPSVNCENGGPTVTTGGQAGTRGTKSTRKGGDARPGTLSVHCATLGGEAGLIRQAYIVFATGEPNVRIPSPALTGGPDWLDSEGFDIEARADGEPSGEMMRGPMMQTLLEDKMKLKVRSETREAPAYALVASEGTPRLQAFQEGSCAPNDLSRSLAMRPTPGVKHCSFFVGSSPLVGPMPTAEAKGATLNDFAKLLSWAVGRPVIDATGITGRFDFHLEFALDENTPKLLELRSKLGEAVSTARPTILTAIQQQYGLKLVPSQAPREFLVVDHVEKPSAN
jgi:bla regulator protein BlaR1